MATVEEKLKGLEQQLTGFQITFAGFKAELEKHRIEMVDSIGVQFATNKVELNTVCQDVRAEFLK
eukprot:4958511-Karenia_brevis.AAC.1